MNSVGIITDSYSCISQKEAEKLGIKVLSMPFYVEEECYYEGETITREEYFEKLKSGQKVSTSQHSPADVMDIWKKGLETYDEILYIPLSSGLSGSCNTAKMLAQEEFEGKVFVVDNGRIATPMHRAVLDAVELVKEGYSASDAKEMLEEAKDKMSIYIAVETLEYLKKGGRITAATAALGTVLNIKPVLQLEVGLLETFKKCRGMKKAKKEMLEAMKHDFETRFKESYDKGEVYLMAASSADEETTKAWVEEIKEHFPGMEVQCDYLPLGVCCHTGEGALGIGCSCRPKRK